MDNWSPPERPAEQAEERLVGAILDGAFPIDSNLPAERELAALLGITRPTLREVLQRMSRDGWIEIRHGHSTRVRNYWHEGNLAILGAIAAQQDPNHIPADFVPNLLQVRLLMAPTYTRQAVERGREDLLENLGLMLQGLIDAPAEYTFMDWGLHKHLTILSGNPVFTLILNGFHDLYLKMGLRYFSSAQARAHSRAFYQELLEAAQANDPAGAEALARRVMLESMKFWEKSEG